MLVLSRREDESIMIGEGDEDDIEIRIVSVKGGIVKLGIRAPRSTSVHRKEVYDDIRESNQEAARSTRKRSSKDLISAAAKKFKKLTEE